MKDDISVRLALAPNTEVIRCSDTELTFRSSGGELSLGQLQPGIFKALCLLQKEALTMEELSTSLPEGATVEQAKLLAHLTLLTRSGFIWHTLYTGKVPLVSRYAISPYYRQQAIKADANYRLSRFAYLHRQGEDLILESPRAHAQMVLHDWRAAAMLMASPEDENIIGLSDETCQAFLKFMAEIGLAVPVNENDVTEEEQDDVLRQWDFHDLLFHSRSRAGRHNYPIGGTLRFKNDIEPLPLKKSVMSDKIIQLIKPDMDDLMLTDKPFAEVLEHRRSIRTCAEQVMTLQQLGEFLYRSCHTQRLLENDYAVSLRPYPSGGAVHALEIYLVNHRCDGLKQGFFHYCPFDHQLEEIKVREEDQIVLLEYATTAQGCESKPSILFFYTARFQRVSWKYSAVAYSLILKEVGALQQTMYLVATAMDLAPCALGTGDSDFFSRMTGLSYEVESTVGEFVLQ